MTGWVHTALQYKVCLYWQYHLAHEKEYLTNADISFTRILQRICLKQEKYVWIINSVILMKGYIRKWEEYG